MKKLFQNKSLLKSIQIFLVCLVVLLLPKSLVYADTWTAKEPMTVTRSIPAAATAEVNDRIYVYVFGIPSSSESTIGEYNPEEDSWTEKETNIDIDKDGTGHVKYGHVAVAVNDKIYVIGGYAYMHYQAFKTVYEYDPQTNILVEKEPMDVGRAFFVAAVVDNKIYVIGGDSGGEDGVLLKTVEEYDPATGIWTPKTSMPNARSGAAAAVVDNKIYVIGGWEGLIQ